MNCIAEDKAAPMTTLAAKHDFGFRRYSVGVDAAREGARLGYSEDELIALARRAARYTDPRATHRHKQLAFVIEDNTILSVWAIPTR